MSEQGTVTILGCGNSTGVPAIGNYWGKCDPDEPKNRRNRPSAYIQLGEASVLIDTPPEIRFMCNSWGVTQIDGVLFTHEHGDHVSGLDDLRIVRFRNDKREVPVYMNQATFNDLRQRFAYLFQGGKSDIYPAILDARVIKTDQYGQSQNFGDIPFIPFAQDHVTCETVGYRIGNFAYCLDMKRLDEAALVALEGIDIWVVDAAGYQDAENPVHADVKTIFHYNERIGAGRVILSSLSLAMDYQTLADELPGGYEPAYDGLSFTIEV
jgi:phosphoribosyl 1,2-cyclic phosphate phosphodiesterase